MASSNSQINLTEQVHPAGFAHPQSSHDGIITSSNQCTDFIDVQLVGHGLHSVENEITNCDPEFNFFRKSAFLSDTGMTVDWPGGRDGP